ncbi:MAG TPA: hypothetical protein VG890_03170 [Puia sp.]|nr:hypothetical protein [Puia sp.]
MDRPAANIISRLQQDILSLQGFRPAACGRVIDMGLGPVNLAFPGKVFPLGAVHEFLAEGQENAAASGGFISGLLSPLMRRQNAVVWISSRRLIFPPALKAFGIAADRVLFVESSNEKDRLWVMEEALRCPALSAVVAEIPEISFTNSRRLQLAVEQSRVTGFILRNSPRQLTTTAAVCRWRISALPSQSEGDLPGLGFPRWKVELLKVRNGKPGAWDLSWKQEQFHFTELPAPIIHQSQQKTG